MVFVFLDMCNGQNIGNAVRFIPYGSISHEFANQVGFGHSGITVDAQSVHMLVDVLRKPIVAEHIDGGLVIQQNLFFWKPTVPANL
jgi:hypothetical protein